MREFFAVNGLLILILSITIFFTNSCSTSFNPSDELKRIEQVIINGEADSLTGYDEKGNYYKYWINDGQIIKLHFGEDGYECLFDNEYYFKDDGTVFANKTEELCPANGTDYKAVILFDGGVVVNEEYWIGNNKVSKTDLGNHLVGRGSIEDIIHKDSYTKKIKGTLNISDFAERFNFIVPSRPQQAKDKESKPNVFTRIGQWIDGKDSKELEHSKEKSENEIDSKENANASSNSKDILKYSDIRGLLINSPNSNDIEKYCGKADDVYSVGDGEVFMFYNKVELNGQVGSLLVFYNWDNHVIEIIEFHEPGSRMFINKRQYIVAP